MSFQHFDPEAEKQKQEQFLSGLEQAKTDQDELTEILDQYDFDDAVIEEFNAISERFLRLRNEFHLLSKVTQLRLNSNV